MKNVELIVRDAAAGRRALGLRRAQRPRPAADRSAAQQRRSSTSSRRARPPPASWPSAVGALTGVPGVCVSTLGPGATNLATGVGAAWLDSAPVIAITCNVATPWLNRRIQMRIDHHALFAPITKASFALRAGCRRRQLAAGAHAWRARAAGAGAPRPARGRWPRNGRRDAVLTLPAPTPVAADCARTFDDADDAARRRRKRPVVVAGLGLTRAGTAAQLLRSSRSRTLPFILTLHAKGFLPESHPNYAGVLGRARRSDVQAFVDQADLIIAVGYDEIEINYEEWAGDTPDRRTSSNRAAERGEAVRLARSTPAGDLDAAHRVARPRCRRQANDWTARGDRGPPRRARP